MNTKKFIKSLVYVIPILVVAILGSVFVNIGMDWFNALNKPSQWIPNVVIPIVWTVIYVAFLIILLRWQNEEKKPNLDGLINNKSNIPTSTNILLAINGVLNVLWCLVFFALKQTFLGNIVIILNLIAGILLILDIYKCKKIYAYILLIYPIWLSIATTLNLAMWILN